MLFSLLRTEFVILLILLAMLGAMGFITYFVVNGFRFEDHNTYSVVRTENREDVKSTIEQQYCLTESPDLVFIGDDFVSTAYFIDYEYKGKPILFYQGAAKGSENTNTENKVVLPVEIGEYKGFFIQIDEAEGLLEWYQDGYYFTISGIIDKTNAVNLAQSTKMK